MILLQVGALLLFAVVALYKVYDGSAPEGSTKPELDWLSPFAIDSTSTLVSALLIGVFIYWGWESAVNLTEETRDSARAPGLAAVVSTVILLVTYVVVSIAVLAYAGLETLAEYDDDDAIFAVLGSDVLGSPLDKLVILAIVTSAIASTQTTIIPSSRTSFSMGRQSALPRRVRGCPSALPHALVLDARRRRARDRLVRAAQPPLPERALRHALRALADDRLLLRADRSRMRGVLPPRAHEVGEELPLHRGRAARRRRDSRLPLRRSRRSTSPTPRTRTPGRRFSGWACRSSSGWASCCWPRAARDLEARGKRAVLRSPAVREGRSGGRCGPMHERPRRRLRD